GRRTESVETKWRRKDGRRLVVRLLGIPIAPESVDLIVEDITDLRAVEARLRQAHQMEAVGRLAWEVGATCDKLLRDVSQDCQQWLAAVGSQDRKSTRLNSSHVAISDAAWCLKKMSVRSEGRVAAGRRQPRTEE